MYDLSNIYQMEPGEVVEHQAQGGNMLFHVLRVPGGWIFYSKARTGHTVADLTTGVFVPYNTEFKQGAYPSFHNQLNSLDD